MPRRQRAPVNEVLPIDRQSVGVERQWLLLAAFVLFLLIVLAFAGGSWAMVLYRFLSDGLLLLLWLTASTGVGHWLLKPFRQGSLTSAAALGIGAYSLALLTLGLAGWLNRATAWGLIVVGVGAAVPAWRDAGVSVERVTAALRKSVPRADWLWLAVVPFAALGFIAALMPPGLMWGADEPNGYDVVEYHLQVPREWYELGRIVALKHNVFSYFPFNVEVHYLWAMNLRGGPWAGMYLAQLMHLALVALSVAAVYGFVGRKGLLGVLMAAATPWLTMVGSIAYNEGGVLLFGTLCVGWAIRAVDDAPNRLRLMALAGVFAGLACGVKLTAVPMLLGFVPVAFALAMSARREAKAIVRPALAFVGVGALVFSPWLLRNLVWAKNPLFPEAMSWLGHARFSAEQVTRWQRAYVPPAGQGDLGHRAAAVRDQIFEDWRFGFALFPAAAVAFVGVVRRRVRFDATLIVSLTLFALWLALWGGFTHLQGRFFVLAVPLAALMISRVQEPLGRLLMVCALTLQVGFAFLYFAKPVSEKIGPFVCAGVMGVETYRDFSERYRSAAEAKGNVCLIGDAEAFLYQLPTARLHYRTVFDVDARGRSAIDAWADGCPGNDGDSVTIDYDELARFHRTYFGIPPPPAPTTSPASGTP